MITVYEPVRERLITTDQRTGAKLNEARWVTVYMVHRAKIGAGVLCDFIRHAKFTPTGLIWAAELTAGPCETPPDHCRECVLR